MRPPHFLAPNKAKTFPTKVIAFDCETEATSVEGGKLHTLKLGVACFWRRRGDDEKDTYEWLTFTQEREFWEWVESHCKGGYTVVLTSHNLGFDMLVLHAFTWLPFLGWNLRGYYSKGLTTICRFAKCRYYENCGLLPGKCPKDCKKRKYNRRLRFVDNTNFFRGKLKDLGELVDLPKLEVDFEEVSHESLERYCIRDVAIVLALWEKWLDFLSIHDLGKWCWTLPSQALSSYRHRFMRYGILVHDCEDALSLERQAYHGGRTEVLRVGEFTGGPFYKLDVNSMYPYVMHRATYPIRLYKYSPRPNVPYLRRLLKKYLVIAECLVETEDAAFPQHLDGWTCYPTGIFRGVFTTPELTHLLERGRIHEVYRLAYYAHQPIFGQYVDFFYNLKARYTEEGNKVFRSICKGFLNFLYGKFGQRGMEDKIVGSCPLHWVRIEECYDTDKGEFFDQIYLAGAIIERRKKGESYNSFPAIAAHVTANARLYLYRLFCVAGRRNVFYVDTDSLIVNQTGYENLEPLVHPTRLGGLKVEGITDHLEIRAPKDYMFGPNSHIKGIRDKAIPLADGVYEQDKFPGLAGILRKGNYVDYVVERTVKTLTREIHSGRVTQEGFVLPFVLGLPSPFPS